MFLNYSQNAKSLADLGDYFQSSDPLWELDGCGNSDPVSKAAAALSAIKAIQTSPRSSMIEGFVGGVGQPVLSKMHVEAKGQEGRFNAITDDKGEFRIRVPPGRYTVNVVEAGRLFDWSDLSYPDLEEPLEPGGCAQVQFDELARVPSP